MPHVVLVVNKIDLVGYSEDVFNRIATDFALLSRSLGCPRHALHPVSATEGDNVVVRSRRTPWYDGPDGARAISSRSTTPPLAVGSELRFPVQHVVRPQNAQLHRGRHQPQLSTATTADTRARSNRDESASVRKWSSCLGSPTRGLKPSIPRRTARPGGRRPVGGASARQRHRRLSR